MPTKNRKTKDKILELYLEGKSQEEIFEILKDSKKEKKLKQLIKESEFLSPKNFRYGSFAMFFIGFLSPTISVYLRGIEYRPILDEIILITFSFSLPFLLFALLFFYTKNLKKLFWVSGVFNFYLIFFVILIFLVGKSIDIWTLGLLPAIFIPIFLGEFLKLQRLVNKIRQRSS